MILPFDNFTDFPTTGSENNLYYDSATGLMYYWNGTEYVPIGGEETITDITNTITGHKIGTYTNESGDTTDINETITVISLGANNTISYVSENGQTTNLDLTPILGDKYYTNSTTCQDISTASGNLTMQVSPGLSYIPLQTIIMQDATNSGNHLHCDIVSYNKLTGELVVNVKQKSGQI